MSRKAKSCAVNCPHKKVCDAQFLASGGKIFARSSRMVHAARFVDFEKDDPRNKMQWPDYCAGLTCYFANYKRCQIHNSIDNEACCKFCRDESGCGLGVFVEDASADHFFPDFDEEKDNEADKVAEPPVAEIEVPQRAATLINEPALDVRMIEVGDIADSPYQVRHIDETDDGFLELVESIKVNGLLQPVVVRPAVPGSPRIWELIAGHRRVRAVSAAGLTEVAARVVRITDKEAEAAVGVENINREDLRPMELVATVTNMRKNGRSVEEIARAFGKSVRWVYRTQSMGRLTPEWDEIARKYKLSQRFLLELGRIPEAAQDKVYDSLVGASGREDALRDGGDIARLRYFLNGNQRILLTISDAKWSDEFPFWCALCPKRSDKQPDLFEGDSMFDEAKCLDSDCWNKKLDDYPSRLAEKLEHQGEKIERLTEEQIRVVDYSWSKNKQYSKKAIIMEGWHKGEIVFIAPNKAKQKEDKPKGPTKAQKRDADFIRMLSAQISGYAKAGDVGKKGASINDLSGVAAAIGISTSCFVVKGDKKCSQWGGLDRAKSISVAWKTMTPQEKSDAYWAMVKPEIITFLRFETVSGCGDVRSRADLMAAWLNIDTFDIELSLDEKYGDK